MRLKKRIEQSSSIKWTTLVKLGVKDSEYNRSRYKSGFALDLLAEVQNEPKETQENTNLNFNEDWLKEQELEQEKYLKSLEEYNEQG